MICRRLAYPVTKLHELFDDVAMWKCAALILAAGDRNLFDLGIEAD